MNKRYLVFAMALCGMAGSLLSNDRPYYVIDGLNEDNSAIKMWYTALALCDEYDKGLSTGFEITFENDGKHFSPDRGANWWKYYFASHVVGSSDGAAVQRLPRYKRSVIRFNTACTMRPERAHYLVNKYMPIQLSLEAKMGDIIARYWPKEGNVVGVFYQNPLMSEVQQSWDPIALCERVKEEVKNLDSYIVIIFSELEYVIKAFKDCFGAHCVRISELENDCNTGPAERGEHELLTLFLLAQCDMVIAPGSYQSIGAKMMNPLLQLKELDPFPYAFA